MPCNNKTIKLINPANICHSRVSFTVCQCVQFGCVVVQEYILFEIQPCFLICTWRWNGTCIGVQKTMRWILRYFLCTYIMLWIPKRAECICYHFRDTGFMTLFYWRKCLGVCIKLKIWSKYWKCTSICIWLSSCASLSKSFSQPHV